MCYCMSNINSIVFDCDGVLLNSNKIKTQAFYKCALPYGEKYATMLADYHIENGGISRNYKFKYFLNEIIPDGASGPRFEELMDTFSTEVKKRLLMCEVAPCLASLRERTKGMRWLIVSGGNQDELNEGFQMRGLHYMFDGGIYGSPDSKDKILDTLINNHQIELPSLFLGDSQYDYEVAAKANLDFVFVSDWSEFSDWPSFCIMHGIASIPSICEFMPNQPFKTYD